jgi:hypothetical protein
VDLPFDERRRTDLPQVFRGSAHFSKSMWKEPVKFFKIHPDCIWTGKYSSGSIAPGMLLCQQVMPEGACAQSPNPSRAGGRDHSKVLIEPVQEQSLRRHVAGVFSVHIGDKIPLGWEKRREQKSSCACDALRGFGGGKTRMMKTGDVHRTCKVQIEISIVAQDRVESV